MAKDGGSDAAKRIARTEAYAEQVRKEFAKTVNALLALNKSLPTLDPGVMYSYDGASAKVRTQAERLLLRLRASATTAIERGIELEWGIANDEADKLLTAVYGKKALTSDRLAAEADRLEGAMRAFIGRSDRGLNLSERVWQSCRQLRDQMEVAMTVAIGEGESASAMSRRVRQYLNDPDLMFRRFRYKDERGEWRLKWKKRVRDEATGKYRFIDYDKDSYRDQWTGRGYYKSAAQNAMRVARTETNIAYRTADHERWQRLDFVLGQRIQLSEKHPCDDICDELQGDYPKDFKFTGWHPQCFCYATPLLVGEEEMVKMNEAFAAGKKYAPQGERVTDYPKGFKRWVADHADDIAKSDERGTTPYFIKDNRAVVDEMLKPKKDKGGASTAATASSKTDKAAALATEINGKTVEQLLSESNTEPTKNGKLHIHPDHGKNEVTENKEIATYMANKHDHEILLLPKSNDSTSADAFNITLGYAQEFKANGTSTVNAIDRLIRDGSKQADSLVIRIPIDCPLGILTMAIRGRVRRCPNLKEITIIMGDTDMTLHRAEMLSQSLKIQPGDFK